MTTIEESCRLDHLEARMDQFAGDVAYIKKTIGGFDEQGCPLPGLSEEEAMKRAKATEDALNKLQAQAKSLARLASG